MHGKKINKQFPKVKLRLKKLEGTYGGSDVAVQNLLVPAVELLRVVIWRLLRAHIVYCTAGKHHNQIKQQIYCICTAGKYQNQI